MAQKFCSDCGLPLTGLGGFTGVKCPECLRVPFSRAKAFFDRTPISEQDIQNGKISQFLGILLAYGLVLVACIVVGSLLGLRQGGLYTGLIYAFIATILGILAFRIMMTSTSTNPLNTHRWFSFAIPITFLLLFSWAVAYMFWMPPAYMLRHGSIRSIFSHHVLVSPTLHLPAFTLALLVGIVAGVAGGLLGFWIASSHEARIKAQVLALYHRWQQAKG